MGPYQYWLDNGVKVFSLQFNFLRPSIYDLKTDESDPSFLSISQKAAYHQTYTKFKRTRIHFDDFLLPCNIPIQFVKPLTVFKHLVISPLDDKDKSYYTALYKQTYSYNELLLISAKTISFMVQTEYKNTKQNTNPTPHQFETLLTNFPLS